MAWFGSLHHIFQNINKMDGVIMHSALFRVDKFIRKSVSFTHVSEFKNHFEWKDVFETFRILPYLTARYVPECRLMINVLYLIVTVGALKNRMHIQDFPLTLLTLGKCSSEKRFMASNLYQFFIFFSSMH